MHKTLPIPKPATLIVHTTINVHQTGKLPSKAFMLLNGRKAA